MRTRFILNTSILLCLSLFLGACGLINLPQDHRPVEFTAKTQPHRTFNFKNWPVTPQMAEGIISDTISSGEVPTDINPDKAYRTAHGVSGPNEVLVIFPKLQTKAKFKWKVAPSGNLEDFNNSISRELASYQIQKLFLEPIDYVVPTSLAFCIKYQYHSENLGLEDKPQVPGSDCVFGNASLWLQDVKAPPVLFEKSRFLTDPDYAYYLSNFNILTYLIEHRDTRSANVLVPNNDLRYQAFSIDNGTTFGTIPYNYFAHNWNIIRVPALRNDTVSQLRLLRREDLDTLGVVAQLNKDSDRVFRNVIPDKNLDPAHSVRIQNDIVQFGLTQTQIDDVWDRMQQLIAKVNSGEIPVF